MIDYKNIKITDFLAEKGYQPSAKKGYNWWYLSPLHDEHIPSFKVDVNKNVWYDFGLGKGGGISALVNYLYKPDSVRSFLRHLANIEPNSCSANAVKMDTAPTFANLVVKDLNNISLLSYLANRGISNKVAKEYCKEVHYANHGKNYFAIGFPNQSGGYEIRNSYFKGCISPKDISVLSQNKTECHVFEGFMDLLSYVMLHGECDAVVLNSVINASKAIDVLNTYNKVYCHLDNDVAGRNATLQLTKSCTCEVWDASSEYTEFKDMNEYLTNGKKGEIGNTVCRGFRR